MNQDHIDFIEKHKINFETVKLGYTRQIPMDVLQMYEHIYHQYLDPQYVLTYWCGGCVFDMMKRLMHYYETNVVNAQPVVQAVQESLQEAVQTEAKPKAKRTKK
jgi:hypothetical protein